MTARSTIALLCTPLLAVGVAACGTTNVSTSSFKGEQRKVAQAVANLQSAATALEAKKVCGEDLAAANVARLNVTSGGCKKAIESQLKEIDSFEATVDSVAISGDTAIARVKGVNGGKKVVQTMTLVKEGGKWRVSGIG
jgi:Putative lumazine-binding